MFEVSSTDGISVVNCANPFKVYEQNLPGGNVWFGRTNSSLRLSGIFSLGNAIIKIGDV